MIQQTAGNNRIIPFLTFVYLASSYVFIMFSWGRYVMFASVVALLVAYVTSQRGILYFPEKAFLRRGLIFIIFCFFSVLWAASTEHAISRSITIAEIFICTYVIFLNYYDKRDVRTLLKVLMWSGYAEGIVLCAFYGVRNLLSFSISINGDLANQNMIGIVMAVNIVVTLYMVLYERPKYVHLFAIVSIILLAVSTSRTAMIGCIAGVIVIVYSKLKNENSSLKKVGTILGVVSALIIFSVVLEKTGMFDSTLERMKDLTYTLQSNSGDGSSRMRMALIEEGLKQFLKTPILGLGINNSFYVAIQAVGHDFYMHNNYVEMLVNGGIVGFLCYASLYIYPLISFIKYRKNADGFYYVSLAIFVSMLIMDMGTVSYYTKETYFYLMIMFIEAQRLRESCCMESGHE